MGTEEQLYNASVAASADAHRINGAPAGSFCEVATELRVAWFTWPSPNLHMCCCLHACATSPLMDVSHEPHGRKSWM